jgi:hypothetical protein
LRPNDAWVLDRLNLLDVAAHPAVPGATPTISVHDRRGPSYDITSGPTDSPFVLMLGEGYDARWRATVDGRSMGSPVVVDGYATGWVLHPGKHHIEVRYGPQRWTDLAMLVSLVTLLLCLFLGVLGIHRFYVGKIGTGLLWLFTGGLFGIGYIVDLILIITGNFTDKQGNVIRLR